MKYKIKEVTVVETTHGERFENTRYGRQEAEHKQKFLNLFLCSRKELNRYKKDLEAVREDGGEGYYAEDMHMYYSELEDLERTVETGTNLDSKTIEAVWELRDEIALFRELEYYGAGSSMLRIPGHFSYGGKNTADYTLEELRDMKFQLDFRDEFFRLVKSGELFDWACNAKDVRREFDYAEDLPLVIKQALLKAVGVDLNEIHKLINEKNEYFFEDKDADNPDGDNLCRALYGHDIKDLPYGYLSWKEDEEEGEDEPAA